MTGSVAGSRATALVSAAVVSAIVGLGTLATGFLAPIEDDLVDARFALRPAQEPTEVAVVAVDDVTFDELGLPWPLPRSLYGRAMRRLEAVGAREVIFDVQFTEATEPKEDLAFYDALGRAGGAVLATSETDGRGGTRVLGGDDNLEAIGARAAAANLPDSRGGIVRRFTHSVGGLETIAVATAKRVGRPVASSDFESDGAWIDFRGGPGTVPTVSLSRLISGRFDTADLRGRIVVVGASAPSVGDVHATPTAGEHGLMPGPELQANAIWTALHRMPLRSAPWWLDTLAVLLAAAAVPLLAVFLRAPAALLALPLIAGLLAAVSQVAFLAGSVITLAPALVALAVGGLATVVTGHQREWRERRRMTRLNEVLDTMVRERTQELAETQLEMIQRLGRAVESRDEETGDHVERIGVLAQRLALAAGLGPDEAGLIRHASVLHDIGKISIPDAILRKPGRLDAQEWVVMRSHTTVGAEILAGSSSALIRIAETIARSHHERWDGLGYPAGLAGEEIPLAARICAVCDVYDALISKRPYKPAWTRSDALTEISARGGRHLDPRLAGLFVALIDGEATDWAAGDGHGDEPLAPNRSSRVPARMAG